MRLECARSLSEKGPCQPNPALLTRTETGPTSVHVPDSPTGIRSLTLRSTDGGITVTQT